MENIVKEVDEIILFSDTIEGIAASLEDMLQKFEENNPGEDGCGGPISPPEIQATSTAAVRSLSAVCCLGS